MRSRRALDGNAAAAEALRLARVGVVAAYPITPQSSIAEKLAEYCADGSLKAHYIRVESEHTAMSAAIGAQLTGVRAATATSSVGLALMHEVLGVASGCRVPIVMPVVNRALVAPWNLWCDHQDTMSERDSGWLQFYVENAQEVLDALLMAYRVAEHPDVLTPAMVCLDGFFVSHSTQLVLVPDQSQVDALLAPYRCSNLCLDPLNPMFINNLIGSDEFTEMRFQQSLGFERALRVIPGVQSEFHQAFGRKYEMVEAYRCEDAEVVLVTLGSMGGTAKYTADRLRGQGRAVGVASLHVFRPFPVAELQKALAGKTVVGVLDRSAGLGAQGGPVWLEVNAALAGSGARVFGYVGGLGGRDIAATTIERIYAELMRVPSGGVGGQDCRWIDVRPDAMQIRQVADHV